MKKIYLLVLSLSLGLTINAQNQRIAKESKFNNITPLDFSAKTNAIDTMSNFDMMNDTITFYASDNWGFTQGHNGYGDKGWAERFIGSGTVKSAFYLIISTTGGVTSLDSASANIYSRGTNRKPNTLLGSSRIAYADMNITPQGGLTMITFQTPITVTDTFFVSFNLDAYTTTTDTLGLATSRNGNKNNNDKAQNSSLWSDDAWYFESTENWGLKVNYLIGCIADITNGQSILKNSLELKAAFPNPTNSTITFNYNVKETQNVTIRVIDMSGKTLSTITKNNVAKGSYSEIFDSSNLSAGMYYYIVSTNDANIGSIFNVVK